MEFVFDLNTFWFVVVGVLLAGYAILDGFDLGVGSLHLFTKTDEHRRVMINSIGPVWDGNEVWLITGGGALFAAFPHVYATVFSGFYTAFMLLLAMLIFRAVSIEFRSKMEMKWWRQAWDIAFSVSSIVIALLMGVALGNVIQGVPIAENKEFVGGFWDLINPFSLLVGVTTLATFMMHGSIYVVMKTDGELQKQVRGWINNCIIFFVISFISLTMWTLIFIPHMTRYFEAYPWLFVFAFINMLAVANIPREIHKGREFRAFLSSCFTICGLMLMVGIGIFPNLVISSLDYGFSLDIYNSASSEKTLAIMRNIAFLGVPFVLAYTISIYWIFRGKVKIDSHSY
jgi:cytochrome d ubiquinol oxidase subunit II